MILKSPYIHSFTNLIQEKKFDVKIVLKYKMIKLRNL